MPRKPKPNKGPLANMTQAELEEIVQQTVTNQLAIEMGPSRKIRRYESRTLSEYLIETGLTMKKHTFPHISLRTPLVKYNRREGEKPPIEMHLPFMTAAMQSVTGPDMMIRAAQLGFIGTGFCSQPVKLEAKMVEKVKRAKAGFVIPHCVSENDLVDEVLKLTDRYSTFPVTENGKPDGRVVGVLTRYGLWKKIHAGRGIKVRELMLPYDEMVDYDLVVAADDLSALNNKMVAKAKKYLVVVDDVKESRRLQHMVFRKDLDQALENPHALIRKSDKTYVTAAAVNTHDYKKRIAKLVDAGVDIIVIDSSDGYSEWQGDVLKYMKRNHKTVPVMGGNVINREGFRFLVENGAWAVKVGMGGGSICITREQKGTGKGQADAVEEVCDERDKYYEKEGIYIPVISDGGVVVSKDIVVALILGADAVMMGRYFARFQESPPDVDERTGMKPYWGEGSRKAREWMAKRYGQMAFEEGVEGMVPYLGPMERTIRDTVIKMKSTMISAGCSNIEELHLNGRLIPISAMTMREGGAHDIIMSDPLGSYMQREWGR